MPFGNCTPEQQQQRQLLIIENGTYLSFVPIQTELNVEMIHPDEYATRQKLQLVHLLLSTIIVLQPMLVVYRSTDDNDDGKDVHEDEHMHFHPTLTVYQALPFLLDLRQGAYPC